MEAQEAKLTDVVGKWRGYMLRMSHRYAIRSRVDPEDLYSEALLAIHLALENFPDLDIDSGRFATIVKREIFGCFTDIWRKHIRGCRDVRREFVANRLRDADSEAGVPEQVTFEWLGGEMSASDLHRQILAVLSSTERKVLQHLLQPSEDMVRLVTAPSDFYPVVRDYIGITNKEFRAVLGGIREKAKLVTAENYVPSLHSVGYLLAVDTDGVNYDELREALTAPAQRILAIMVEATDCKIDVSITYLSRVSGTPRNEVMQVFAEMKKAISWLAERAGK